MAASPPESDAPSAAPVIAPGNVALITGGASGIGRALADRAGAAGMRVVLADIDDVALRAAEAELTEAGVDAAVVVCDTTSEAAVEAAVAFTMQRFGGLHLLCNNAGIAGVGDAWRGPVDLWRRVIDINLLGVVYGVRAVLDIMGDQECGHIVNTASMAGLGPLPGAAPYTATKHAVVALSESLFLELQAAGSPVGISALCPGFVKTNLMEREPDPSKAAEGRSSHELASFIGELLKAGVAGGIDAAAVADEVFAAVEARRFWILTHPEMRDGPVARMQRAAAGINPPPFGGAEEG